MLIVTDYATKKKRAINVNRILIVEPGAMEETTNLWLELNQKPQVIEGNFEEHIESIKAIKSSK